MEKTLAQLEAEVEAKKQELVAAEKAKRDQTAEAERKLRAAKRQEYFGGFRKHADAIVAELIKAGYTDAKVVDVNDGFPAFGIGKSASFYAPSIRFENSYSGYHSTGKVMVKVGGYGGRTFPLRKDGTYNYAKIAEAVRELHGVALAHVQRCTEENTRYYTNRDLKELVCKETGVGEYSGVVEPSQYTTGKVVVQIKKELTGDEAIKFINALKEMGIKF